MVISFRFHYLQAAKTDVERDDWIVTLRKACDEKRYVSFSVTL